MNLPELLDYWVIDKYPIASSNGTYVLYKMIQKSELIHKAIYSGTNSTILINIRVWSGECTVTVLPKSKDDITMSTMLLELSNRADQSIIMINLCTIMILIFSSVVSRYSTITYKRKHKSLEHCKRLVTWT